MRIIIASGWIEEQFLSLNKKKRRKIKNEKQWKYFLKPKTFLFIIKSLPKTFSFYLVIQKRHAMKFLAMWKAKTWETKHKLKQRHLVASLFCASRTRSRKFAFPLSERRGTWTTTKDITKRHHETISTTTKGDFHSEFNWNANLRDGEELSNCDKFHIGTSRTFSPFSLLMIFRIEKLFQLILEINKKKMLNWTRKLQKKEEELYST